MFPGSTEGNRNRRGEGPVLERLKYVANEETHTQLLTISYEQANKDRAAREAIVAALREQLKQGDKSLVGNKVYRKRHKAIDLNPRCQYR